LIFIPFAGWVGEQGEKSQLSFWEKKSRRKITHMPQFFRAMKFASRHQLLGLEKKVRFRTGEQ